MGALSCKIRKNSLPLLPGGMHLQASCWFLFLQSGPGSNPIRGPGLEAERLTAEGVTGQLFPVGGWPSWGCCELGLTTVGLGWKPAPGEVPGRSRCGRGREKRARPEPG